MIRRLLATGLFAWLLLAALPAQAVLVYLKDSDQPVQGFLIRQDSLQVVVDELLPDGRKRQRVLPKVNVEFVKEAFNPQRLEALDPSQPAEYRAYAEELAVRRNDPEARHVALRLYLTAAWLDPQELGRSCLLGMSALARTPAEERAFQAMAFVLDQGRDASLLKPTKLVAADFVTLEESQRAALWRVLRLLRQGDIEEAKRRLRLPQVKQAKKFYEHLLSDDDYQEALAATGGLSDGLLRKILTLEITLAGRQASGEADDKREFVSWSDIVASEDFAPAPSLSLTSLTGFDPQASVYRNGKWVTPAGE